MSKGQQKARDPVCGMEVAPGQHARVHLQMEFAFCSEQCRARFLAHPHLYIGYPGGSEISAHRPTFTFLGACRAWAIVASKVRERGQFFDRLREERSEGWSRSYLTKRIEKMDRSPTGAVDQPQVRQAPSIEYKKKGRSAPLFLHQFFMAWRSPSRTAYSTNLPSEYFTTVPVGIAPMP